jgi:cyanophycin synthetase
LYLNGKFEDAIRRDPPIITGDGKSTIKQLIEQTNNIRLNSKPFSALSPLTIDDDLIKTLEKNKLKLKDIPADKKVIVAKSVINQNSYKENHIVRNEIHPDIIKLGAEIVKFFGIELGGIDIISESITEPLEKTGGVVNEINTTPGLHHHDLVAETEHKIQIGEKVLQYIFNKKSRLFSQDN